MQSKARQKINQQTLTLLTVFSYWLPLALSWLLILLENPVINAVMARLSAPEKALAAFGVVMSVSVVIESAIVPLLSTVNALAKNRQHYFVLRNYSILLALLVVGVHGLISFTGLYDTVILKWINLPLELVVPVRLGLQIMLPWSGFIAWRRFNQGVLIRTGETKAIGQGTVIRLSMLVLTVVGVGFFTNLPSIAAAALAAIAGTFFEALFIQIRTIPIVREEILGDGTEEAEDEDDEEEPLTYWELTKFHMPLFASTLLFFLARPMVSAALARTPNPTLALAAWPVFTGLISLVRAPAISMPEVAISLGEKKENFKILHKFAILLSVGSLVFFVLIAFTPLRMVYFKWLMGVSEELILVAISGAAFALLSPIFGPYTGFIRGILTLNRKTFALTIATAANILAMGIVLVVGVRLNWRGVPMGAAAMSASYLAEFIVIMIAYQWMKRNNQKSAAN